MKNLKATYMGLELKNPIIAGSSNLSFDIDSLKGLEDAGASAIVFKSLFEEQILLEKAILEDDLDEYAERHAEMTSLFPKLEHAGAKEYLLKLEKARKVVSVPLFASLNAIFKETWVEYARQIEQTGVDGIELNFFAIPKDADITGSDIEKQQLAIVHEIKKNINIPISVKLSPFYSNTLNFIKSLDKEGVDGLVLFNRFYNPDIVIENMKFDSLHHLSHNDESKLPLRYAGLLYSNIAASICCNSGIHQGTDVIKMLLAGADCVQVVSTLYRNKLTHIKTMLHDIELWMDFQNIKSLEEIRGKLSRKNLHDPFVYQRAQYIDLLIKSDELMNKYTLR